MPRARILQVITQLELGGAQEIALHVCRHLDRSRFDVHLAAGRGGLLDREAASIPEATVHWIDDLVREVRPAADRRALGALTRLVRELRRPGLATIVHTHSSKAGILGRWAGWLGGAERRVHSIHGFGFHPRQPWIERGVFELAERATARVTDAFLPVSQANRDLAFELGLLAGDKPAPVAPPGIEVDAYTPRADEGPELRRELGLAPDAPLVGMIACLKPQKAPVDFVKVAARVTAAHPSARFFVAGDGVLRPAVEAAIREHGLDGRLHLLGWRDDVRVLLGAADLLVLTSLHEGLPRVCLQAMAASKPMVATRVDGVPEAIVDGENGFLVEPGDVDGSAERVGRLVADPVLRRRLGERGRERLAPYDAATMMRTIEGLYDRLLDGACT